MGRTKVALLAAALALAASVALVAASATTTAAAVKPSGVTPVLFVGNNWDGTADVIKQGGTENRPTFQRVARSTSFPTSRNG